MSKVEQIVQGVLISLIGFTLISITMKVAETYGMLAGTASMLLFVAAVMTLIGAFWKASDPWLVNTVKVICWITGLVAWFLS